MKILFVIAEYFPDGAGSGRSVQNLAQSMSQRGHDVVVVRLTRSKPGKQETLSGVKIYHLPIRNLYWVTDKIKNPVVKLLWHIVDSYNLSAMRDLDKILKAEKPDVVNTNVIAGFSAGIFQTIKRRKIPLVHTLRDYYLLCPKSSMFKSGRSCVGICASCKPFAAMRKTLAGNVDLFLANSDYVLRRHQALNFFKSAEKTAVQFNMNDNDETAQPKNTDKNKTIRFGFIGRIDEVKGLEILLSATRALEFENWSLKIAGSGDEKTTHNLRLNYPDERIEMLGFTDANAFYAQIDVLICPSLYAEPLPRVVFEAYRAGLPVIAANTGGTSEIIDHGQTGYLYDPYDIKALAGYMKSLSQNPDLYAAMSLAACEKAGNFTRSRISEEFETHLHGVLNEGEPDHVT